MSLLAILVLAAGTYAFRAAGPLLAGRLTLSERVRDTMTAAAAVLLTALTAISALTEAGGFAGWARTTGVAVAAVLAVRRAPFPVVVLAAAGVTAGLRALGVA